LCDDLKPLVFQYVIKGGPGNCGHKFGEAVGSLTRREGERTKRSKPPGENWKTVAGSRRWMDLIGKGHSRRSKGGGGFQETVDARVRERCVGGGKRKERTLSLLVRSRIRSQRRTGETAHNPTPRAVGSRKKERQQGVVGSRGGGRATSD